MQDMTSIKYSLCPDGQQYAAGKTNLKESIGHPLNTNGCTILICTSGSAIVSTNFQRQVMKKGDATILFYGDYQGVGIFLRTLYLTAQ